MELLKRITANLNLPIKRIGFVILVVGLLLTLIGLIQIGSRLGSYRWFEKFIGDSIQALSFDNYSYRRYPLACIGPYVLLVGIMLSFLYDKSLGRLLAWIRNG